MARDRGSFPIYDSIREERNPMVNRIKDADPALYEDMVKYGRNIALLTIAPTGTTSIMTQTFRYRASFHGFLQKKKKS